MQCVQYFIYFAILGIAYGLSNDEITFKNEFIELQETVKFLKEAVVTLEETNNRQERQIRRLTNQNIRQESAINGQIEEIRKLYKSVGECAKFVKTVRNENSVNSLDTNNLSGNNSTFTFGNIGDKMPYRIRKERLLVPTTAFSTEATAFYAYMSKPETNEGPKHTLIFDVIKSNFGGGYHSSTGVFIVPVDGVYVFTWTIRQYKTQHHTTELMVNTASVGSAYLHTETIADDESVSGTVVVYAAKGNDVYVRTHPTCPSDGLIHSDPCGRSSFAGWKLH